jgi:hypothetical protein
MLIMVLEVVRYAGYPDEDRWLVYKTDLIGGRWPARCSGAKVELFDLGGYIYVCYT